MEVKLTNIEAAILRQLDYLSKYYEWVPYKKLKQRLQYNERLIKKTIKENNLFFAICGKKTDGHKFVKEAVRKGAIKSIVSKKIKKLSSNKIIKVKNTFSSLKNLAKVTRDNSSAQIVGITGSVGKTTLKNLFDDLD